MYYWMSIQIAKINLIHNSVLLSFHSVKDITQSPFYLDMVDILRTNASSGKN